MPPSRDDIRNDIAHRHQTPASTPATEPGSTDAPSSNDIRNDVPDPGSHRGDITARPCPVCGQEFTPIRRQRYCTPACRQAAWRTRHPAPTPAPLVIPPTTRRRDHTVYECSSCGTRRLGQQWCPDCNRPAVRLDLGGLCPHCDGPITITDITDQHPKPSTSR